MFLANYRVSLAERIFPASDLSEQISTAGKEASGTGNMKFALNGALTIGTLDGANIEIRDEVGPDNFFLFGLTAQQVLELQRAGYRPREYYEQNAGLKAVLDLISSGFFEPDHPELFRPLIQSLLDQDTYMLLADFQSYVECQERVSKAFQDPDEAVQHVPDVDRRDIGEGGHHGLLQRDLPVRRHAHGPDISEGGAFQRAGRQDHVKIRGEVAPLHLAEAAHLRGDRRALDVELDDGPQIHPEVFRGLFLDRYQWSVTGLARRDLARTPPGALRDRVVLRHLIQKRQHVFPREVPTLSALSLPILVTLAIIVRLDRLPVERAQP